MRTEILHSKDGAVADKTVEFLTEMGYKAVAIHTDTKHFVETDATDRTVDNAISRAMRVVAGLSGFGR